MYGNISRKRKRNVDLHFRLLRYIDSGASILNILRIFAITVFTENSGIAIKSITTIKADAPEIYVSLTGDQCVLTNIRIS